MSTTTQRLRIQDFIQSLAKAGTFPVVAYQPDTGQSEPIVVSPPQRAEPRTCICRETGARFSPDQKQGRRQVQKRDEWFFELRLAFDKEVSLEEFEDSVMDPVPVLAALDEMPSATVRLVGSDVTHPATQTPSGGTFASFQFRVENGRA